MEYNKLLSVFLASEGVSTDTRTLAKGQLFFALSGPNFNGNKFALTALEAGAYKAVVDDPKLTNTKDCIYVKDTLAALQGLAKAYRQAWTFPVIALTGSNGKTTTKELLTSCLSQRYQVISTVGNLNNHIGVPLTLLSVPTTAEVVVVEMGANHQGEIADLCEIALPSHGLITNIGTAHLEGFGGPEGVAKGKSELYRFLGSTSGQLFVNTSDPKLVELSNGLKGVIPYASRNEQAVKANCILAGSITASWPFAQGEICAEGMKASMKSKLPGAYSWDNICAAAAIASYFKVPLDAICDAIAAYDADNGRNQVVVVEKASVLKDSYNANPDSMRAALEWLASRKEAKKIAVVGEMAELGSYAKDAHDLVITQIEQNDSMIGLYYGEAYKKASIVLPEERLFNSIDELLPLMKKMVAEVDTVILLKGSRVNRLEEVLLRLKA